MPGFDGTGPTGTGPFGRGLGPCGGGYAGRGYGGGMRRGGRFGWGFPTVPFNTEVDKPFLEQRKAWLESQLAAISEQMKKASDSE
ncbi:MAG TPA: DUF5320 domain-containing protein [Anaerolineaceae bacterium]|nr:DUF5320 domain-containing protein [Anaerolineaceae bacterium]HPC05744.1 DUF5320 domain-containing protein [Anaerolineaceae bacterium]HQN04943.1 DUF5320 domain-containing protein [Anaerolineaceae bacterium]HQP09086.1 DUF5320 domain-containing protein [Anaerolineaceae bacterium]